MKPAPLLARPRLKPQDHEYLDAFHSLSASRSVGMGGANAISVSEILAYVNLVGIASQAERLKYLRLIQQMDRTYLDHQAAEAEKKNKNNG